MIYNVGILDRSIRFVLGWFIITAGFYYQTWWGAVGFILLLTGFIAWCPVYSLLNIDSGAESPESAEKAEFL
jgi:hypothetical protein